MTVGERIKARRKEIGISADLLADRIGVSRSTIFRYENGSIEKLPLPSLDPIARALFTSVQYLMGWTDDPSPAIAPAPSLDLPSDESELLGLYRSVTEPGKAVILGNARMIAGMDEYKR